MATCPICRKTIRIMEGSTWECSQCNEDFKNRNFRFRLPESLNLELFEYADYMDFGNLFFDLEMGHLKPEEYDTAANEIVKRVNQRGEHSPIELQRSRSYAQSLLRH